MGKVIKFTGSKLLGAELRRLRGGRSLKQIAELSKSPPLSERVAPVAAPTLCQIENGISFPSLETIHALAQLYKRPVQQLLDLVVQERVLRQTSPPATIAEAMPLYREAVAEGEWHRALAVALWAEGQTSGSELVKWRANRAQVLRMVGLAHDAVDLLEECVESEELSREGACQVHQALADAMAKLGLIRSASLHSAEACRLAPADLKPAQRRRLLRGRAFLLITAGAEAADPDEREAREAGRLLEEALSLTDEGDDKTRLLISVQRCWARMLEGNVLVAVKELEGIVRSARADDHPRVLLEALHALGECEARRRRLSSAVRALEEAGGLAADADDPQLAFDCYLRLYELTAASQRGEGDRYLRRCERFYPLVTSRSGAVRRYERLTREERG